MAYTWKMEPDNSVYSTVNFYLKANELEKEAKRTQKEGCFAAFPWIHMKNVTDAHTQSTHRHTVGICSGSNRTNFRVIFTLSMIVFVWQSRTSSEFALSHLQHPTTRIRIDNARKSVSFRHIMEIFKITWKILVARAEWQGEGKSKWKQCRRTNEYSSRGCGKMDEYFSQRTMSQLSIVDAQLNAKAGSQGRQKRNDFFLHDKTTGRIRCNNGYNSYI